MISDYTLDKSTPVPLYYQLKNIIEAEVDKGHYQAGDMIPTEEELTAMFGISRTTVRQAVTDLVREGRLYRIKSKGTFVPRTKINQDFINRLVSYSEQIKSRNMTPKTEILELRAVAPPPAAAQALGLAEGEKAIRLFRKRFADDTPVVLVQTYLPYSRCAFLLNCDFSKESLYSVLETHSPQYKIHYVKRVIEAVKATSKIAKLLEIKSGDPVLYFTSLGCTENDLALEYSIAHYRGDSNRFEITVMA